ncbi:hypothetical protein [Halomonas saccharevitans]|uniref:Adhesin n=1 Tax=Halomonas saccharevitans TaxID=416872 RepID=A0A1I6ZBB0_9GAMM|nr:hypothetical protein [Halomonas saccharevitans]SFT59989.1 hypothetical protein SAMN04487956_11010 [Halomonas saccharevitans]
MKTFQKAPLALAITALMAAPYALADGYSHNKFDTDSYIDSDFDNKIDVELRHDSDTYKNFYVNVYVRDPARHYSGATVDSKQLNNNNGVDNIASDNNATLGGNALRGSSGNMGVNVAAGDNNSQANDAALSASDAAQVFGQAAAFSAQSSSNNSVLNSGSPNNARLGGNALQGATGNIGVNVAAGVANAQQNSLAASANTNSGSADATAGGVQTAYNNSTTNQGLTETFTDTVDVSVSGIMVGGYAGHGSGTYGGTWQQTNQVYPEVWVGGEQGEGHPSSTASYWGHMDFDGESENTDQFAGSESGTLEFQEAGLMAMGGTLSGGVTTTNTVYVANENNASLGGNALRGASGNIGVNVAAGTNNLQRNSMAIASASGGANGGGGEM